MTLSSATAPPRSPRRLPGVRWNRTSLVVAVTAFACVLVAAIFVPPYLSLDPGSSRVALPPGFGPALSRRRNPRRHRWDRAAHRPTPVQPATAPPRSLAPLDRPGLPVRRSAALGAQRYRRRPADLQRPCGDGRVPLPRHPVDHHGPRRLPDRPRRPLCRTPGVDAAQLLPDVRRSHPAHLAQCTGRHPTSLARLPLRRRLRPLFATAYAVSHWTSWLPNLLLVEVYLARQAARQAREPLATALQTTAAAADNTETSPTPA